MPAGIATDHPPHTGHLGKQRLGTPETAAAKDCHINSSGIIRNPAQCKRIDTVAQPFRCRAVGEHMAEVRLADIAQGLDPLPAMRPITGIGNYSLSTGCVNDGQPVPESNFVRASKSASSQPAQA